MKVKNSHGYWVYRNLLGNCWKTREVYGTYAKRTYHASESWAYQNAQVLCLAKTARIEVTIIHVDKITNKNLILAPDTYIQGNCFSL